jgi:hypothetical protein
MFRCQIGEKITSAISMAWYFTTKSSMQVRPAPSPHENSLGRHFRRNPMESEFTSNNAWNPCQLVPAIHPVQASEALDASDERMVVDNVALLIL